MQQRGRQRKRTEQAAKTPNCPDSLGLLTLGAIGRSGQRPLQKESRSQDNLVKLLWPSGIVLVLLPQIPRV